MIICGEEDALRMGVARADEMQSQTTLCQKLQESITIVTQPEEDLSNELSYEEKLMQVNPMVGMENVTPYDFLTNDGN